MIQSPLDMSLHSLCVFMLKFFWSMNIRNPRKMDHTRKRQYTNMGNERTDLFTGVNVYQSLACFAFHIATPVKFAVTSFDMPYHLRVVATATAQ